MKKRVFVLEEYTNNRTDINFETYDYTHLRAFHACRPLRLEDYLKNGINPINYKSAIKDVKDRIVSNSISLKEAVAKLNDEWKKFDDMHKRVWLQMNKNILLGEASHYLIYGSEFINSLSLQLFCRERLKYIGIPTIFHCDIPLEDIDIVLLNDIQNNINNNHKNDISLSVEKVEPNNIVNYEHPEMKMINPFGGYYEPDYKLLKDCGYCG